MMITKIDSCEATKTNVFVKKEVLGYGAQGEWLTMSVFPKAVV